MLNEFNQKNLTIQHIELLDFRNYEHYESGEFSNFNIFVGHNGVGKTNIIEAIQIITALQSFRNPKWDEVVRWGRDEAAVLSRFHNGQRNIEVKLKVANHKRMYSLNGKSKTSAQLRGLLPSVLFCPDDLQIVKGYSECRRDALDSVGSQISNTYNTLKSDYLKAVKQKNALLQSDKFNPVLLDPWNENIAILGASFAKHRISLFDRFRKNLVRVCLDMVKNLDIDVVYIPSWEEDKDVEIRSNEYSVDQIRKKLIDKMNSLQEAEIATGRSLSGPHRDEIRFYMNGMDARKYASQGQQRFIALSWKIAEMETIYQICGQMPVLLLDDVLSELDKDKKGILAGYLLNSMQTFITATDVDSLNEDILQRASIFRIGE